MTTADRVLAAMEKWEAEQKAEGLETCPTCDGETWVAKGETCSACRAASERMGRSVRLVILTALVAA